MNWIRSLSCLGAIGVSLYSGSVALADDKPITIGFAVALTGWLSPFDNPKAAELYIEHLNAEGGLLGRQIKMIYSDTKSDPAQGAKAGLDVLGKGADFVVVSCDYDLGAPAALEANKAGKIAWSVCAEDPKFGVQGIGPMAFTTGDAAQLQGVAIAEWAYKEQGIKNPYVLTDTSIEYSKSVCFGFNLAWKTLTGSEPASGDSFKNGDPSIASQLTRIKRTSPAPDAIVLCTYPPGGASATRQIRSSGLELPILTNTAMDGNFWLDAVPNLSNFYYPALGSIYGDDPSPAINDFTKQYEAKFKAPLAESHSLTPYVMMELYTKAVEQAKTTESKAVVAALETFKDVPTLLGPYSFSNTLHIQTKYRYTIMSVEKGKHKALKSWTTSTPLSSADLLRKSK